MANHKETAQDDLSENSLYGGGGADRLDFQVSDGDSGTVVARDNVASSGYSGNDRISVKASSKGAATSALASGNSLYGGDGNNQLAITVDQKHKAGGDAIAQGNQLYATIGNSKFTIAASAKGVDADARADSNGIFGGEFGSNRVKIQTKSSHSAYSDGNTIYSGDGSDQIDLFATAGASSEAVAQIGENVIGAGTGKNRVSLSAKASDGGANIESNLIGVGTWDDTVSLKAAVKLGVAVVEGNEVVTEDGDNNLRLEALSSDGSSDVSGNTISGGIGTDRIELRSTDKKAGVATASENLLAGGEGFNQIDALLSSAKGHASFSANTLVGGASGDLIDVLLSGKQGAVLLSHENLLSGNEGSNTVKMALSGKGAEMVSAIGNTLSGGTSDDFIQLSLSDSKGAMLEVSDTLILASEGTNSMLVEASTKNGDVTIEGSRIYGASGDDFVRLLAKTTGEGSAQLLDNEVAVDGGVNRVEVVASGGDSEVGNMRLFSYTGDDSFLVSATASGDAGSATIDQLRVGADAGDDWVELSLQSNKGGAFLINSEINLGEGDNGLSAIIAGDDTASFSGNQVTGFHGTDHIAATASAEGDVLMGQNTLVGGQNGTGDSFRLTAESSDGDAAVEGNNLYASTANDYIELIASGRSEARVDGNYLYLDHALTGDVAKLSASSAEGAASVSDNRFFGGDFHQGVHLSVAASGDASINGSYLGLDEGDDFFGATVQSDNGISSFIGNTIGAGDGHDSVEIRLSGEEAVFRNNHITLEDGHDRLVIEGGDSPYSARTILEENQIDFGSGYDTLVFENDGQIIDFTGLTAGEVNNLETLVIGSDSHLKFTDTAVLEISGDNNIFTIESEGQGNTVDLDFDVWSENGSFDYAGSTFHGYLTESGAILNIEDGIGIV